MKKVVLFNSTAQLIMILYSIYYCFNTIVKMEIEKGSYGALRIMCLFLVWTILFPFELTL